MKRTKNITSRGSSLPSSIAGARGTTIGLRNSLCCQKAFVITSKKKKTKCCRKPKTSRSISRRSANACSNEKRSSTNGASHLTPNTRWLRQRVARPTRRRAPPADDDRHSEQKAHVVNKARKRSSADGRSGTADEAGQSRRQLFRFVRGLSLRLSATAA